MTAMVNAFQYDLETSLMIIAFLLIIFMFSHLEKNKPGVRVISKED